MATLIKWKNKNGNVVADFHKHSRIIYVGKDATAQDIEDFKKYLEKHNYQIASVFNP